jgi:hypothetical protein
MPQRHSAACLTHASLLALCNRQQVRTQLEALEAAAAKVLPPPPAAPRAGVASLFSRSST